MSAFAIIAIAPNPILDNKIAEVYPHASLKISDNAWFVADTGVTTQEVSEKIDVKKGGIAGVVIVKVESYFGLASSGIWEWLKVKASEG